MSKVKNNYNTHTTKTRMNNCSTLGDPHHEVSQPGGCQLGALKETLGLTAGYCT